MAHVACMIRGYWGTNVQLLNENMQQWNLEGYNLNLINFIVAKINIKQNGDETYVYLDHTKYKYAVTCQLQI